MLGSGIVLQMNEKVKITKCLLHFIYFLLKQFEYAYINGKLLQPSNVDGSLFAGIQIAASYTQVTGRANHATRQAQRVIRKNLLCSSIIILANKNTLKKKNVLTIFKESFIVYFWVKFAASWTKGWDLLVSDSL